ncbi:MAG: hypothetical protein N2117_10195 [Anaerolineales bacterium]|nr:hypothetical protein [Anaerolineales bacterium]MCX7755596.1 hypothetical protein [Anaerolineales bacterium]MDW8277594.1 hypothetical protein [Anaerolineales bacterium]
MMSRKALFPGLVFDEYDRPLETGWIGSEPAYVIDDAGFRRHVPSEQIDRAVLHEIKRTIAGHEEILSREAAKLIGAEDPFSKAIIENQLKNIEKQFESLFEVGLPEEMRAWLGMIGFKVIVNYRGEVIEVRQAGRVEDE